MDDNQVTQQSADGELQIARVRRHHSSSSNFLVRVVQQAPWLPWLGLWLVLMLVTGFSIFSLTYTGTGSRPRQLPPVITQTPVATASRNDSYLALWVLGAIAACGAGYWIVFQQLQPSRPSKTRQKRLRRRDSRQRRLNQLKEVAPIVTPTTTIEPPTVVELSEPTIVEVKADVSTPEPESENDVAVPEQPEPLITILPPEDHSHVDVENVSLAEMMDLRKHRSLSSLLGGDSAREQRKPQPPHTVQPNSDEHQK